MSKQNKKQKKGDIPSGLQQQYEKQRRQLLDCQFSIKKLQQRLNDLVQQNIRLKKSIDDSGQLYNDTIQQLSIKNMANQKRLLGLSNQKTKLQIDNQQKQNKIKLLQKNLCIYLFLFSRQYSIKISIVDQQQLRIKDLEQSKKNYHFQLAKYQSQLSQYKLYMGQRDQLQQQRQQLRQKIQIQKANKLRQIADKERQKVQATDKIKDQMNHKIKQMERNLVSLKRQQLQTTTRLTMLQNHQLTSQLQYQSKQTQKLIFKNQQLQQKISSLKQQLQIHKQVQDQLAKRSHFSKGVIRKLNIRINQLQSQIQKLKNQLCLPASLQGNSKQNKQSLLDQSSQKTALNQTSLQISNQNNKRLITSLQQQLQKSQKKYVQLLTHYQNLQKQKQSVNNKLNSFNQKANQIYKILHRYYQQIILKHSEKSDNNLFTQQVNQYFLQQNTPPYQFNLKHLRQIPIEKWKLQDLSLTVQILLNIIQPYMVRSNVVVPSVRKNIILTEGLTQRKSDSLCKSLPKLSTERKQQYQNKVQQIPVNIASKIVGSNLRQWGQTVKLNKMCLKRKYKVAQSFRN